MSPEDPFPGCETSYLKACWALQILCTGWLLKEEYHSEFSEFDLHTLQLTERKYSYTKHTILQLRRTPVHKFSKKT
jgi:hypothetical protein